MSVYRTRKLKEKEYNWLKERVGVYGVINVATETKLDPKTIRVILDRGESSIGCIWKIRTVLEELEKATQQEAPPVESVNKEEDWLESFRKVINSNYKRE